jgi:hypothetical protein
MHGVSGAPSADTHTLGDQGVILLSLHNPAASLLGEPPPASDRPFLSVPPKGIVGLVEKRRGAKPQTLVRLNRTKSRGEGF